MRCRSLVRMVASCVPACNLTGALAFVCRCPCASQVLTAIQWQCAPRSRTFCGRGLCLQRSSSIFDRSRWRARARLSLTVALFFRVLFGLRRALRCCFWWGDGDCCLGPRRRELTVRFGDVGLCDDDRARARGYLLLGGGVGLGSRAPTPRALPVPNGCRSCGRDAYCLTRADERSSLVAHLARFVGGGSVDLCRVARWGSRAPCRALSRKTKRIVFKNTGQRAEPTKGTAPQCAI